MPITKRVATFKPINVTYLAKEYGGAVHVYNLGKNIVGYC